MICQKQWNVNLKHRQKRKGLPENGQRSMFMGHYGKPGGNLHIKKREGENNVF